MNVNATDLLAQLAAVKAAAIANPASPVAPAAPNGSVSTLAPAKPEDSAGNFESLVTKFIGDVNQKQLDADKAVLALAAGETDNVHDVVLTAVKANMSARMLFEIRNQLVQAYQEVMRMQL